MFPQFLSNYRKMSRPVQFELLVKFIYMSSIAFGISVSRSSCQKLKTCNCPFCRQKSKVFARSQSDATICRLHLIAGGILCAGEIIICGLPTVRIFPRWEKIYISMHFREFQLILNLSSCGLRRQQSPSSASLWVAAVEQSGELR